MPTRLAPTNAPLSYAPRLVSFDFLSQGSTRRSRGTAAVTKDGAAAAANCLITPNDP